MPQGAPLRAVGVIALRNPFGTERRRFDVPAGATLADIVHAAGIPPGADTRVWIADPQLTREPALIPGAMLARVRPKPGMTVTVRALVANGGGGGGGGKSVVRIVLQIAVMAAAFAVGNFVGAALGGPAIFGRSVLGLVAGGLTSLVGNALVNAIAPPPTPKLAQLAFGAPASRTSPTLSITGTQNRANPFGPVPRVYGRHRVFPALAAQPFTELVGDDQYLNLLFTFGHGPLELSDLRIGAVPLDQFDDVETEVREGREGDAAITLYRNQVNEDLYALTLTQAGGARTLESRNDADEVQVDFTFQGLVRFTDAGARERQEVRLRVEYRAAGSDAAWRTDGISGQEVLDATGVEEIAAPEGALYTDFRTTHPIQGAVSVTLAVPATLGPARLFGIRYRVYARSEGETAFTLRYQTHASTWELVGSQRRVGLTGIKGKRLEVRIERADHSFYTDSSAAGPNSGTFRAVPAPSWSYPAVTESNGEFTFAAATEQIVRRAALIRSGGRGRFEIRLTRITADTTDVRVRDEAVVTAVRTITAATPVLATGLALVAMRIRATDQLNGVVDQFSAVAAAVLPVWNGSAWTEQPTRNPAWAYLDVLRGRANARPVADARLDLPAFLDWAEACDASPPQSGLPDGVTAEVGDRRWTFDAVIDYATTVFEMLGDIAASARARFGMRDGQFSIVRDVAQATPIQLFSPRNSSGFTGERALFQPPHALRVRFINPDRDWQQDEVIAYADGQGAGTATRFETLELFGCTSPAQAWREGRYHLAVGERRRESWRIVVDVENLVAVPGDLVRLAHDVPRFGEGVARIAAVAVDGGGNATGITLDDVVGMVAGLAYAVRIRYADGTQRIETVVTAAGESATVTFATAIPVAEVPAVGDLVAFGPVDQESRACLVRAVRHDRDFRAEVELIDAAPEVHLADQGALPPLVGVTTADPFATPPAPVQDLLLEEVVRWPAGTTVSDVVARWRPAPGSIPAAFEVYRFDGAGWRLIETTTATRSLVAGGLPQGETVMAAVVAVGRRSARTSPANAPQTSLTTVGDLFPPPDAETVAVEEGPDGARRFHVGYAQRPPNFAGFRFRAHAGTARSWSDALPLHDGLVTALPFETAAFRYGTWTVLVKPVNSAGVESTSAAVAVVGLGDRLSENLVQTADFRAGGFAGTKTNAAVDGEGALLADDTTAQMWSGGAIAMWAATDSTPMWGAPAASMFQGDVAAFYSGDDGRAMYGSNYPEMAYADSFTPEAAGLLYLDIEARGLASLAYRRTYPDAMWSHGDAPMWSGDDGTALWHASAIWVPYSSRVLVDPQPTEIRAMVAAGPTRGRITRLKAIVDAPDVVERFEDVTVPPTGVRLTPTKALRVLKNVSITLQDDGGGAAGARVVEKDPALGALVQVFDTSGLATSGVVDAVTQGY